VFLGVSRRVLQRDGQRLRACSGRRGGAMIMMHDENGIASTCSSSRRWPEATTDRCSNTTRARRSSRRGTAIRAIISARLRQRALYVGNIVGRRRDRGDRRGTTRGEQRLRRGRALSKCGLSSRRTLGPAGPSRARNGCAPRPLISRTTRTTTRRNLMARPPHE